MRRRFCIALAMWLLISGFTVAQDSEMEFNRQRLSIEYRSGIFGSWSQYGGSVGSYAYWRFFEGFGYVEESEFLRIAGYENEALQAEAHARTNKVLMGTAWGLIGASGACVVAGLLIQDFDVAIGVLMAGMVLDLGALIPVVIVMTRGEHWMPLQQAYSVAEEYNSRLRRSLQ